MALTFNGVKVDIPSTQVPAAYTKPTITTFDDYTYFDTVQLTVLKSTVHDADPAVTINDIINDATIGLEKQIEDIITFDFETSNTVTAYASWTALDTNYSDLRGTGDYLTTTAVSYLCTVKYFVKVS